MPRSDTDFLDTLENVIKRRLVDRPENSYTSSLADAGIKRIAQKTGEEAVELALASVSGDASEVRNEAADLLYHLLVLLAASDVQLSEVIGVLRDRHET